MHLFKRARLLSVVMHKRPAPFFAILPTMPSKYKECLLLCGLGHVRMGNFGETRKIGKSRNFGNRQECRGSGLDLRSLLGVNLLATQGKVWPPNWPKQKYKLDAELQRSFSFKP